MFLLNKVTTTSADSTATRPATTSGIAADSAAYSGFASRPRDRKPSRMRTSFFGGTIGRTKSFDGDTASPQPLRSPPPPPQQPPVADDGPDRAAGTTSPSLSGHRRRLRKMTSKSSLASVASFSTTPPDGSAAGERRSRSRLFQHGLFQAAAWSQHPQLGMNSEPRSSRSSSSGRTHTC